LVGAEVVAEVAISVVFVGFWGSTSAAGSTNDTGTALVIENRSGEGPVCFRYAAKPRFSCASSNKSVTVATVNLRYLIASMRFITEFKAISANIAEA
jgi:hypothetical protein